MNRETWLNQLAKKLAPRFEELGHPLPKFRVSIGWPSSGKDAPVTGECWDSSVSGDQHFEIFLNPGRDDDIAVACTLIHELVHAAVGLQEGHKGNFAKVALALGFQRPLTQAQQPEQLLSWLNPILEQIGKLSHAAIRHSKNGGIRVKRAGGGVVPSPALGGDGAVGGGDGPINNRPKKQTTRLLKCVCAACGYNVRVTQKWLDVGAPHCPEHGEMAADEQEAA